MEEGVWGFRDSARDQWHLEFNSDEEEDGDRGPRDGGVVTGLDVMKETKHRWCEGC
jgi:hypothetical protein